MIDFSGIPMACPSKGPITALKFWCLKIHSISQENGGFTLLKSTRIQINLEN